MGRQIIAIRITDRNTLPSLTDVAADYSELRQQANEMVTLIIAQLPSSSGT